MFLLAAIALIALSIFSSTVRQVLKYTLAVFLVLGTLTGGMAALSSTESALERAEAHAATKDEDIDLREFLLTKGFYTQEEWPE